MSLKKKIYPLKNLVIIFCFIPGMGLSQQTFSLEDLVQRTLNEHYQIQLYRNQETIAANNNTLGNAGFLPSVDLTGEHRTSIENSQSDFYTGDSRSGSNARNTALNAMIEINWLVFDGFRMFARRDRLGYLQQLSIQETKYFIEQTIADVTRAYYQFLKERQILENYRQSMDVSGYRLQLEKQKRQLGSGNALLYNQALVDYHNDSSLLIHQKTLVQNLEIGINRIVNRELEANLSLQQPVLLFRKLSSKDSLINQALAHNKDLQTARLHELLAEANTRLESGDRYPEISLFGNYSFSRQTSEVGFVESGRNFGPQFGVRVRFNLYNGNRDNIQVQNARIEEENTALDRQDIELEIKARLLEQINRHQSLFHQLELTRESLEAAEQSIQIAQQQLESGAINGYDFRQTQLALLQVQNRLINLTYEIKSMEVGILRLSGKLIEDVLNN
ncbi:MAG: TolC family protein [Bacteroidetes bacterium]|jgi:outer membrane protein TolC|nr:TolC family protein [Bacteroidota bacterium]